MTRLFCPTHGDGASHPFKVGDHVTIGDGTTLWRLTGFWLHGATEFANLRRTHNDRHATTSTLDQLRLVTRAEDVA